MANFTLEEIEFLNYLFAQYTEDHLSPSTFGAYSVIISEYLENNVLGKIKSNDYRTIFLPVNLNKNNRTSNVVRPALLKFLEALKQEGFIEERVDYLKSKNNIEEVFSSNTDREEEREIIFLSPSEIKVLFSKKIKYRTEEEENIVPLLCSLSFFCMMKQGEINKLKLADLDLENKRIKNTKMNDDGSNLVKWIKIEENTYSNIIKYLKYRESIEVSCNDLIVGMDGKTLDNRKVNHLFASLRRNENRILLNDISISQELLIRSMMLYILTSTNGHGIYKLLLANEPTSQQFQHAFKAYLSMIRLENRLDTVDSFTLMDVVPKKKKEPYINKGEVIIGMYSEDNDINEVDLKMYDEDIINIRNLEKNKVTIQRMIRNSKIVTRLKEKYNNKCQLCGFRLRKSNGEFSSEGHHIKAYNKIHKGDDNYRNIIILCPNCHTQFDDLYFAIHPETQLVHCILESEDDYHLTDLMMVEGHILGKEYLEYTWGLFEDKKSKLKVHRE